MEVLNVDYIAWIVTVLGAMNSNLAFIFLSKSFSVEKKVKNFEETRGKFLA